MATIFRSNLLEGRNETLRLRSGGGPSLKIIEDTNHRGMYRVRLPDGGVSDMVNLSRAKDAARAILLAILNSEETPTGASLVRSREDALVGIAQAPADRSTA